MEKAAATNTGQLGVHRSSEDTGRRPEPTTTRNLQKVIRIMMEFISSSSMKEKAVR
jgi:hypothetical protein